MLDPATLIHTVDKAFSVERMLGVQAAFERQCRVARRWMWFHIAMMLVAAVMSLAISAWLLLWVAVHWATATLWEGANPATWQRKRRLDEAHWKQLSEEAGSHFVIDRLRADELDRTHPWRVWARAAVYGFPLVGAWLLTRARLGPTFAAGVAVGVAKAAADSTFGGILGKWGGSR